MFESTATTVLFVTALVLVGTLFVCLAFVGLAALVCWVWRQFAARVASPYIARERRRARIAARRERWLAEQRKESALRAASTVADQVVRTVMELQLGYLAVREDEHLRRVLSLVEPAREYMPPTIRAAEPVAIAEPPAARSTPLTLTAIVRRISKAGARGRRRRRHRRVDPRTG